MSPSAAWEQALPLLLALCFLSFGFGYLLGSIPFGLILTKLAGFGDLRADRLRQYRRDQCAAHRQQRSRRAHAAARRCQRHRRRSDCGSHFGPYAGLARRARRLSRPSLPGLARLSRRQRRRHLSRRAARALLACRVSCSPPSGSSSLSPRAIRRSLRWWRARHSAGLMLVLTGQWRLAACSCLVCALV